MLVFKCPITHGYLMVYTWCTYKQYIYFGAGVNICSMDHI